MAPTQLLTTICTLATILIPFTATMTPGAAHPTAATLPTLRLDYYAGNRGMLARFLDPALVSLPADIATVQMVNAGLVRLLPNGNVVPDLATWRVSRNHLVYTFTIRQNARFNNGHPVTAADAAFSIKRALDPSTASDTATTYLGAIKGAFEYSVGKAHDVPGLKVLSRRVLQIRFTKPIAYFLTMLAYPTDDILDHSLLAGKTASAAGNFLSNHCPGNQGAGPFRFTCFDDAFYPPGEVPSYTLVPNHHYFGHKPRLQVILPAFLTSESSYTAYLAGDVDATPLPLKHLPIWRRKKREYREYPTSRVRFLVPNVHLQPFNDVHCRRALAYAIDRKKLVATSLTGTARPLYGMMPSGIQGHSVGDNPHYNSSRAAAEIARCGERAVPVGLLYDTGMALEDSLYTAIVGMMNAAGFNAKPDACGNWPCSQSELQSLDKLHVQIAGTSWQPDFRDPADYFMLLRCNGDYNLGGWCNSAFDRLVARADVEWNPAKRAKLYAQAQHIALNQGAWTTLFNPYVHELVKAYVHGLVGMEVSPELAPKNGDWSNVSVSR